MKRQHSPIWLLVASLLTACIEPYTPPVAEGQEQLLVVDGFLDGTERSCRVSLSSTQDLASISPAAPESGAVVTLHETDGFSVILPETMGGLYVLDDLPVETGNKYYLSITTSSGARYESDQVVLLPVPEIDSVGFRFTLDGIEVVVNTQGDADHSRFYRWTYVETWQYHAPFYSFVEMIGGEVVERTQSVFRCWKTQPSSSITVGTSAKLSENVLRDFPVGFLPNPSTKYLLGYSVLVRQFAASEEEYEFWQAVEKNTENLGTLFDPLPSRITGNIYPANASAKKAIGFFSASGSTEKRAYLDPATIPRSFMFKPYTACEEDTVLLQDLPSFPAGAYLLTVPITKENIFLIGYGYSNRSCVDCRDLGGTNVKPDFWPN